MAITPLFGTAKRKKTSQTVPFRFVLFWINRGIKARRTDGHSKAWEYIACAESLEKEKLLDFCRRVRGSQEGSEPFFLLECFVFCSALQRMVNGLRTLLIFGPWIFRMGLVGWVGYQVSRD
jgi:hypothetical protein